MQSAAEYQKRLEQADRADAVKILRQRIRAADSGERGIPAERALGDIRRRLRASRRVRQEHRRLRSEGKRVIDPVHIESVLIALRATPKAFTAAVADFPSKPGLYALWGSTSTWRDLGLGTPPDERPLYVGKSETNLIDRPLCQHFQHRRTARAIKRVTSLTGSSSPRRSFAALLRDAGGLRAVPRNPQAPGYFDCYGLSRDHDD